MFRAINIPIEYLDVGTATPRTRRTHHERRDPFAGLLPGSTINGATVQRQQLFRPFPEFGTFGLEQAAGSGRYSSGTIQAGRHFRNGNSFTVQYTRSSLRDTLNYLNPADNTLEDRVSPNDRPDRLSLGAAMLLPFGTGQRWGKDWNGVTNAILGGWRMSGTYQYQSGFPISWNATYWDASCANPRPGVAHQENRKRKDHGADVRGDISCFTSTMPCRQTASTIGQAAR